jgi:hypothetical protein
MTLGFHLPTKTMVAIVDGAAMIDGRRWVRCTQHQPLGCNWLAPDQQTEYERGRCLADSLIRREPAADDTLAREKLVPTAAALRRMVYQLDDIGLPIDPFWRHDGGLAFDLLSSRTTGEKVTIGHANGVITIDVVESLDDYRESLRVKLGEPYRTMLGHFRHEVGHYYQSVLVETVPAQRNTSTSAARCSATSAPVTPTRSPGITSTPTCPSSDCCSTGTGWRCSSTA